MHNYLKAFIGWIKIYTKKKRANTGLIDFPEDFQLPHDFRFCHKDKVHIFVRGLADGKLHSAKNRHYSDFRFYKKQDLKVFCAVCRKRIV